jgi:hypothetical protein
MNNTTTDIYQENDSLFHKIFDNPENARDFLRQVLPGDLKKKLDLENIEVEDTKYVSNLFNQGKDMNVKPLYNSANLPYFPFKSPKRRSNKPRTKWVGNPNEVPFPAGKDNPPVKYYSSHEIAIRFVRLIG